MLRLFFYLALLMATGSTAHGAQETAQTNTLQNVQPPAPQNAQTNAQQNIQPPAPQNAQPNIVREFTGAGTTTTVFFKTHNNWEVRWNALRVVGVAVMSSDGTLLAGGAGVIRGSLFLPTGGKFYLKITDDGVPADGNNPPAAPDPNASPQPTWQIRVVDLGETGAPDQTLTVTTPFFMPPPAAVLPPPETPKLTDEQTRSAVLIKGDTAEGSGFLVQTPDGNFVMTSLHFLGTNPNIKILTSSGTPIPPISLKGAVDCDVALFAIKDDHYNYLPLAGSVTDTAKIGDKLVIPGINEANHEVFSMPAKVLGITADRVDFDNRLVPWSSGAPLVHADSGKVLAVIAPAKKQDLSDDIFHAWPANSTPSSTGMGTFTGLRIDALHGWEPYNQARLVNETTILQEFHHNTRCLDSFLNGKQPRHPTLHPEEGVPDNVYFLTYDKLRQAVDNYKQIANSGVPDQEQRNAASRELLSDLENVIDIGMTTITNTSSFYAFDQIRAKEEIAYRQALKKEFDGMGAYLNQIDSLARTH